jgi:predicted membrane-bound spermidine synthase/tetratricopeptide (TPR) repeat protein
LTRSIRWLLGISFFLSGATALVYQVLWARHLQYFFGSTTEAVSTILAVFMAGLGIGAWWLGRRIDRSPSALRFYGLLEIGIGAYGLISLLLLGLAGSIFASMGELPWLASVLVKIVLSAIVLLPPCVLMGGTLPALLRAVSDSCRTARRFVGVFYAANLLGAVLGTLASGFLLLESLGLTRTAILAGCVNLAIGIVAVIVSRTASTETEDDEKEEGEDATGTFRDLAGSNAGRFILLGLFVSGATVMAYEIAFTRVLVLVFGVSAYAFAVVLAVFLLGLGIGAAVYERWAKSHDVRAVQFAWTQIVVAAVGAVALALVPATPRLVLYLRQIPGLDFGEILLGKSVFATALLLPLALVAGLGVPILIGSLVRNLRVLGAVVGQAYLVNTVGTVAGSLLTGFVLIAALGTEGTLRAVLLANALTGLLGVVLLRSTARVLIGGVVAAVAAVALVVSVGAWPSTLYVFSDVYAGGAVAANAMEIEDRLRSTPNEILFFREGRNATVAITETPSSRSLVVNGHPDGSDAPEDMSTQVMLGAIPLAVHRAPTDVLVIGFGTGVSARSAARLPEVETIDILEIEPAVLEASPYFHHVNGAIEDDPRVRNLVADARSYVAATDRTYDVVVSEPSNPWRAGVANLYTADFFQGVRERLKPGGILAQWMHLYFISADEFRMVLRTLVSVFPEVQVWWLDEGDVVILASDEAPTPDRSRFDALMDGEFLDDRIRFSRAPTVEEFYARYLIGTIAVKAFAGEGEIHTDDRPYLEYRAPRGIERSDGQNAARLLAAKLRVPTLFAPVDGVPPAEEYAWLGIASMYDALGLTNEVWEATRRAVGTGSMLARLRAAELEIAVGNLSSAAALLQSIPDDTMTSSPEIAREAAWAKARFLALQGNVEEARAAFEETGEIEGRAGLELLQLYFATGQVEPAQALAERLLRVARPGTRVGKVEVEAVYSMLLGFSNTPEVATEAARVISNLPDPSIDFPEAARFKSLAILYNRLGRSKDALDAAESMEALGILDAQVIAVQARSLRALGRIDRAEVIEKRLRRLDPESLWERVESPLMEQATP